MSRCFAIFIFESIALHQFLDFLNWVWTNFLSHFTCAPYFSPLFLSSVTHTQFSPPFNHWKQSYQLFETTSAVFFNISFLGRRMSARTKERPFGWVNLMVKGDYMRSNGRELKEQNVHKHLKSRDHTLSTFHCTTPTLKSQKLICFLNGWVNEKVGNTGSGHTISRS